MEETVRNIILRTVLGRTWRKPWYIWIFFWVPKLRSG